MLLLMLLLILLQQQANRGKAGRRVAKARGIQGQNGADTALAVDRRCRSDGIAHRGSGRGWSRGSHLAAPSELKSSPAPAAASIER